MEPINSQNDSKPQNKLRVSLDLRVITALLLIIIIGILAFWQPWVSGEDADSRVIDVSGEASLSAVPDEFVFHPSYQLKHSDKDAALASLTEKSSEVVEGLKKLGVAEDKIKTNSNGYDYPVYYRDGSKGETTYNLQITITVEDKDLAQEVQDYLISTTPSGAVTPQANFSDEKRKQLEDEARDNAIKDARDKAERTAENLGFKLGKVKTVSDNKGFNAIPYDRSMTTGIESSIEPDAPKMNVQPGENDLSYSVNVTYYIR